MESHTSTLVDSALQFLAECAGPECSGTVLDRATSVCALLAPLWDSSTGNPSLPERVCSLSLHSVVRWEYGAQLLLCATEPPVLHLAIQCLCDGESTDTSTSLDDVLLRVCEIIEHTLDSALLLACTAFLVQHMKRASPDAALLCCHWCAILYLRVELEWDPVTGDPATLSDREHAEPLAQYCFYLMTVVWTRAGAATADAVDVAAEVAECSLFYLDQRHRWQSDSPRDSQEDIALKCLEYLVAYTRETPCEEVVVRSITRRTQTLAVCQGSVAEFEHRFPGVSQLLRCGAAREPARV